MLVTPMNATQPIARPLAHDAPAAAPAAVEPSGDAADAIRQLRGELARPLEFSANASLGWMPNGKGC